MRLLPGPLRRRREPAPTPVDGGPDGDLRKGHEAVALQSEREAHRQRRKEALTETSVSVVGWIDERTGAGPFLRGFLYRKVPKGTNWFYTLGSATLFAFLSQAVTGVFLAMYYRPSATQAYESIQHIQNDVFLGQLVRSMHKWGATVMMVLIFLHMGRTFFFGAYKYPRELNWVSAWCCSC